LDLITNEKNILEKEIEKKREKEKAKAAANLGELQFTIDELKEENNDLKRSSHQKKKTRRFGTSYK